MAQHSKQPYNLGEILKVKTRRDVNQKTTNNSSSNILLSNPEFPSYCQRIYRSLWQFLKETKKEQVFTSLPQLRPYHNEIETWNQEEISCFL